MRNLRKSHYNIAVNVSKDTYALINSYSHAFDIINKDVYEYIFKQGSKKIYLKRPLAI